MLPLISANNSNKTKLLCEVFTGKNLIFTKYFTHHFLLILTFSFQKTSFDVYRHLTLYCNAKTDLQIQISR